MISSFIWKMAWRDSRSSRRRLLLFSISITLGIAALVGIGSFRHSLAQAIDDQARSLIGAASRGLIYPSVRNPDGTCIVAFQPNAVQDVTPGANWKVSWDGSPVWTATAV